MKFMVELFIGYFIIKLRVYCTCACVHFFKHLFLESGISRWLRVSLVISYNQASCILRTHTFLSVHFSSTYFLRAPDDRYCDTIHRTRALLPRKNHVNWETPRGRNRRRQRERNSIKKLRNHIAFLFPFILLQRTASNEGKKMPRVVLCRETTYSSKLWNARKDDPIKSSPSLSESN